MGRAKSGKLICMFKKKKKKKGWGGEGTGGGEKVTLPTHCSRAAVCRRTHRKAGSGTTNVDLHYYTV